VAHRASGPVSGCLAVGVNLWRSVPTHRDAGRDESRPCRLKPCETRSRKECRMNAIQPNDLDRLLEDCRTGQNQPVCDASVLENSLRQRMEAMFAERLPRLDFVAIAKASHLAEDGLAKARRGALDEADNAFRDAQSEAASFPFFAAGRRIVDAR